MMEAAGLKNAISEQRRQRLRRLLRSASEVVYGMVYYDFVRHSLRQRADLEHLFVLISFGDLLGLPILPPYYSMRILPYIVPAINNWKRHMLRERDILDLIG